MKIARVLTRVERRAGGGGGGGGSGGGGPAIRGTIGGRTKTGEEEDETSGDETSSSSTTTTRYVEIVSVFQVDGYRVAGLAPFGGDALVVLAFVVEDDDEEEEDDDAADRRGGAGADAAPAPGPGRGPRRRRSAQPEFRVVTWDNEELARDALGVRAFETRAANDYALACALPGSAASTEEDQEDAFRRTPTPTYYLISPKDVVKATPRTFEERARWLASRRKYELALEICEAECASSTSASASVAAALLREIAAEYLTELLSEEKTLAKAASACPRLLRGSAEEWVKWIDVFAGVRGGLGALAPYVPTASPTLPRAAYETVLLAFLADPRDHPRFLAIVKGAFYTLVPIRPRRRGERRSLRTLPGASLRPGSLAFNPRPRRLSTPSDAYELHPDVRSYGMALKAWPASLYGVPALIAATRRQATVAHAPGGWAGAGPDDDDDAAAAANDSPTLKEALAELYLLDGQAPRALATHLELGRRSGAFYTLVPIRPRWRGGRRSLRTFAVVSLRPPLAFNPRPRRLSTPPDAFQLHPDVRLYGTTLSARVHASARPVARRGRVRPRRDRASRVVGPDARGGTAGVQTRRRRPGGRRRRAARGGGGGVRGRWNVNRRRRKRKRKRKRKRTLARRRARGAVRVPAGALRGGRGRERAVPGEDARVAPRVLPGRAHGVSGARDGVRPSRRAQRVRGRRRRPGGRRRDRDHRDDVDVSTTVVAVRERARVPAREDRRDEARVGGARARGAFYSTRRSPYDRVGAVNAVP